MKDDDIEQIQTVSAHTLINHTTRTVKLLSKFLSNPLIYVRRTFFRRLVTNGHHYILHRSLYGHVLFKILKKLIFLIDVLV